MHLFCCCHILYSLLSYTTWGAVDILSEKTQPRHKYIYLSLLQGCWIEIVFLSQSSESHWLPIYDWQTATFWVKNLCVLLKKQSHLNIGCLWDNFGVKYTFNANLRQQAGIMPLFWLPRDAEYKSNFMHNKEPTVNV